MTEGPADDSTDFATLLATARHAWPQVQLSDEAYGNYLRERGGAMPQPCARASELFLACACLAGDGTALALFETHFLARVRRTIARVRDEPFFVAEVTQLLRGKLFLDGKLRDFSGRGPLLGWLRAAALRTALNLHGAALPTEPLSPEEADALPTAAQDPELELLRRRHRDDFRAAFVQAVASLSPRERAVLRMYALEGMNVARIGAVFQVDRSTVSRWIARAREKVLEGTRASVRDRLNLRSSELDTLIRALRAELDASLSRHLAAGT